MRLGRTGAFVVAAWLALVVYAGVQVYRYVLDCPYSDDFAYVEYITGDSPLSWAWLWAPHNEHRIIVPKLIIVWLTRAAAIDFRAAPYLQLVICAAAALACCFTLARRSGEFRLHHALVPLAICSWAYSEAFTWTGAFSMGLCAALLLGFWCAASEATRTSGIAPLVIAFACALLGAMSGGTGIAALVGIVPWFVYYALQQRGRVKNLAMSAAAVLAVYASIYAATYSRPDGQPAWPGLGVMLRFGIRTLASPFCQLVVLGDSIGLMVIALLVFLAVRAVRERTELDAPSLALVVAALGIAAAISIGRAGFGSPSIAPRYALSVAPLVVAVLALLDGPLAGVHRPMLLAAVATILVVAIPAHDKIGHAIAKARAEALRDASARILSGADPGGVVEELKLFPNTVYAVPRFEMLRRAQGSLFRGVR